MLTSGPRLSANIRPKLSVNIRSKLRANISLKLHANIRPRLRDRVDISVPYQCSVQCAHKAHSQHRPPEVKPSYCNTKPKPRLKTPQLLGMLRYSSSGSPGARTCVEGQSGGVQHHPHVDHLGGTTNQHGALHTALSMHAHKRCALVTIWKMKVIVPQIRTVLLKRSSRY